MYCWRMYCADDVSCIREIEIEVKDLRKRQILRHAETLDYKSNKGKRDDAYNGGILDAKMRERICGANVDGS